MKNGIVIRGYSNHRKECGTKGTNWGYNSGCRCVDCTRAHRINARDYNGSSPAMCDEPILVTGFPIGLIAENHRLRDLL